MDPVREEIDWRARALAAEAEAERLRAAVRAGLDAASDMPHEWRQPTDYARGIVNGGEIVADALRTHLTPDDLAALEDR